MTPFLQATNFVFIIGAPRSGTTMLQVLLGEHPQVATTVELTLFRRYLAPWLETYEDEQRNSREKGWHQGLPFVWEEPELIEFLREFIERVYAKVLARKSAATHLLDKHPGNSSFTAHIRRIVPSARFIHVIRDGRDVACSMIAAARTRGFGAGTAAGAAVDWKKNVLAAREAAVNGETYLEFRYEEFLRDPAVGYARVLDFCGLPYEQRWLEETVTANSFDKMKAARRTGDPGVPSSETHYRRGGSGNWREEFTPLDRFQFQRVAGALLRELGYETNPDWWKGRAWDGWLLPLRARLSRR